MTQEEYLASVKKSKENAYDETLWGKPNAQIKLKEDFTYMENHYLCKCNSYNLTPPYRVENTDELLSGNEK